MIITDLPEDILEIIFSFLDAPSFLSFCRTCKDVYQYRQDPAYWRTITSSTFRLPISPLLKADGARWYWLYKRLRTQTRLYTWGQGLNGNLGPGRSPRQFQPRGVRGRMRPIVPRHAPGPSFHRTSSSWPTEAHIPGEVGVIADLQCGGWSTSILSSDGGLYTVGVIDCLDGRRTGESAEVFRRLEYLTQSTSAIRQFSSGRRHVLALTDDGEILSWDRVNAKGLKIFSRSGTNFGGRAVRVVAGWGESSAYVPEIGIVYWIPVKNDQPDQMLDGLHVKEKVIPGTSRHIQDDHTLIEVVTHVVLESWIIWLRSDGKLFACNLHTDNPAQTEPSFTPFEIPGYTSPVRTLKDVQGQFNKFAVFTDTGEVLAGSTAYLRYCFEISQTNLSPDGSNIPLHYSEWTRLDELIQSRPTDNPALQHNQVISLAFGDHHYHALHINGTITSYGSDPQSSGALGLGDMQSGARFRGLRKTEGWRPDSALLTKAERRGRQIWFEPEKRDWLKHMEESLASGRLVGPVDAQGNQTAASELWTPSHNSHKPFMFSEWVEQEGRHWQDGPLESGDLSNKLRETKIFEHDFHLDPYFALAVSASGWHSGGLILVDDERADRTKHKWITKVPEIKDHEEDVRLRTMPGHFESGPSEPEETYVWKLEGFPKVTLPDDYEMPGDGTPRPWRDGRPTVAELGLDVST